MKTPSNSSASPRARTIRASAAVVGALLLSVPSLAAQTPVTISNGLASLAFTVDGQTLGLDALSHDGLGRQVSLVPGSGEFRVRLVATSEPAPGAGPTANDPARWFELGPAGLLDWNTDVWRTPPAVINAEPLVYVVNAAGDTLTAVWPGTIDWTAADPAAPVMDYEVVVRWSLPAGETMAACGLRLELAPQPGAGRPGRPVPLLYASRIVQPVLRVPSFDDPDEALLVPHVGGALVTDPTANPLPQNFVESPNAFPVQLAGFYGSQPEGGTTPTAFVTWDGDFGDHWKTLLLATGSVDGTDFVEFSYEHVPADAFTNGEWTAPYELRFGVLAGDWWDLAHAYRGALAAANLPWYTGPVASPLNARVPAVKDLAAEAYFIPGHFGDNLDTIARQVMDMTRVLGPNVHVVMYGGYAPDLFDAWTGEYLEPGRPSFAAAVREAQSQFGHLVSPYVHGSALLDYEAAGIPPTQLLQDAQAAMLLDESLKREVDDELALGFMCPGHDWWVDWLPEHVAEIAEFTGAGAVYLDYFLTGPCWATDHGGAQGTGHAPGGGNWIFARRSEQIAQLRELAGEAFAVSIEFLMGRWADVVDVMHADIERSILPTGHWLCCAAGDCTSHGTPAQCDAACGGACIAEPHPTARAVPLFRTVHDDVKLSRIIDAPRVARAGRLAWIEATHVFTFGQLPQVTRSEFELWPIFGNRFSFAPYYGYFQPLPGGDSSFLSPFASDGGNDPGLPVTPAKAGLDTALAGRFTSKLAAAVKGYDGDTLFGLPPADLVGYKNEDWFNETASVQAPSAGPDGGPFLEGLRVFHNGGLRRLPQYAVVQLPGSQVVGNPETIPSLEPDFEDGVYTTTPAYTELGFLDPLQLPVGDPAFLRSFVPAGMFQAPLDLGPAIAEIEVSLGAVTVAASGTSGPSTPASLLPKGNDTPKPLPHVAGALAFAATNPWIDRDLPGRFGLSFVFQPQLYPGWTASTPYRVTRHTVLGETEIEAMAHTGDYIKQGHELESGDIVWWTFHPLKVLSP